MKLGDISVNRYSGKQHEVVYIGDTFLTVYNIIDKCRVSMDFHVYDSLFESPQILDEDLFKL